MIAQQKSDTFDNCCNIVTPIEPHLPHHQVLEVLSVSALKRGDVTTAFRMADRRCRIRPLPEPHNYVIRAEALYQMGERAAAIADLAKALQIAPEDLAANRRMLSWGRPIQKIEAARTLIDCELDTRTLRKAMAVLRADGQTEFAGLRIYEDRINGWAVWQDSGTLEVCLRDETDHVEATFAGQKTHQLAHKFESGVSFEIPRKSTPQFISITRGQNVLLTTRTTGRSEQSALVSRANKAIADTNPSVTVIVPVYADYDATRICLESLANEIDSSEHYRLLIVNDASPDSRIKALLEKFALNARTNLLSNITNLGFVGTVNRALKEVSSGDVILLNADTLTPPAFIDRLMSAARSSPDIGTVTPLSNNGEFTSFPVPYRSNPEGHSSEVTNIDATAARVNAGAIVDIPNGIGFCLYITRSCLTSVGLLSESYQRGYLEDVDYCLRARMNGFRNVCATSVYVGHAGSRSFGKQKRSLVVRNLEVLEQKFPNYRGESAAFMSSDPLKAARRAMEACLINAIPTCALFVTGSGVIADIARQRARGLLSRETPIALLLEITIGKDGSASAILRDSNGGVPQSLEYRLTARNEVLELLRVLQHLRLTHIEFFDLSIVPYDVLDTLLKLDVPYDIFLAHTELWTDKTPAGTLRWRHIAENARHVLVPDAQAEASARPLSLKNNIVRLESAPSKIKPTWNQSGHSATRVGLIPVRGCLEESQFMKDVLAPLKALRPELDIVIAGQPQDDTHFMETEQAFVTGHVDSRELNRLIRRYQLDRIILCVTRPLFGHPMISAAMSAAAPVAFLDWSLGQCPVRSGDLPLDPKLLPASAIEHLLPWLAGQRPHHDWACDLQDEAYV